jgi:methylated-DNA-protein-cysteine methyltransferase-like protein
LWFRILVVMPFDSATFRRRVLAVIRRIPRGRVATYGQIAALAGYPRNARRVGQVLGRPGQGEDVPWQRVVNAQGRVSRRAPRPERAIGARELEQERLLKREDVRFVAGRLSLAKYRWVPEWPATDFTDDTEGTAKWRRRRMKSGR